MARKVELIDFIFSALHHKSGKLIRSGPARGQEVLIRAYGVYSAVLVEFGYILH
jgi:hypothetical protein